MTEQLSATPEIPGKEPTMDRIREICANAAAMMAAITNGETPPDEEWAQAEHDLRQLAFFASERVPREELLK